MGDKFIKGIEAGWNMRRENENILNWLADIKMSK